MAGIDVSYGDDGTALQVWFGPPAKATRTEATDDKITLKKDSDGHIVGFERRDYFENGRGGKVQTMK